MADKTNLAVDAEGVVQNQEPTFVCPFHLRKFEFEFKSNKPLKFIPRITDQVNVDKENLSVTPVVEEYDIDAEIQTYKAQCGLEFFRMMLAQGKASPSDAYDDGSHGVNMQEIPQDIHSAAKQADALSGAFADLAVKLGIKDGDKVTADQLIELLAAKVSENASKSANPTKDVQEQQ